MAVMASSLYHEQLLLLVHLYQPEMTFAPLWSVVLPKQPYKGDVYKSSASAWTGQPNLTKQSLQVMQALIKNTHTCM